MARAAHLDVEFTTSGIDTVNRAADGVNLKLGAIGAGLMLTGQQLTDKLSRPILDFFQNAYMGAASLEQAVGKVEAVYGDAADSIFAWAENSAVGFGQSKQAALDMVGTYGQIMQAQGMAQDESQRYSQSLVELAADMSAFTDISIDRSSIALRAALTGEYESLKSFGIVLKAAEVEQEALNLAVADGTSEITEAHRVQARYNLIMKQTTQMHGQFEREADGASGSLAIFRAQWQDLTTHIGSVLLPIGSKVTAMLNVWIQGFMKLPQPIITAAVVVAALVAAIGPLLTIVGMMAVGIAALPATFAAVAAGAAAFMGVLVPLLPVIVAVTAAIGLMIAAYRTNFLGFGNLIDGALGKVKGFYEYLFGAPDVKNVDLDIDTLADVGFYDWTEMPDGTVKHTDLDITATGSGVGHLSWVADPNAPDGRAWTLHVDVDGDGKDDALSIIKSENHKDGTFTMTVTMEGEEYKVWYDETTGKTIVLKMEVDGDVAERKSGAIAKQWQDITSWLGQAKQLLINIFHGDWGEIDWDSVLGISKLRDDFQEIYDLVEGIFNFFRNDAGSKSSKQDDYDMTPGDVSTWGVSNTQRDTKIPTTGGSNYSDPYNPILGGGSSVEATSLQDHLEILRVWEERAAAATEAAMKFANSQTNLDREALLSIGSLNAQASTFPIVERGAGSADRSVSGMASGMGNSFRQTAANALSGFNQMRSSAVTQSSAMQTAATSAASTMATRTGSHILGMRTAAALQMGLMASGAATAGSNMNTGLTSWMAGAITRIVAAMASIVAAIRGVGSTGYDTGYYAGSMISQGFAAGMLSQLGVIRGAANQMVAAAAQAVIAKAMISSPSRLFAQYGEYLGEGLEVGMLRSIPNIGRAADRMFGASLPSPGFAGRFGSGQQVVHQTVNHNYYVATPQMLKLIDGAEKGAAAYAQNNDPYGFAFGGDI